MIRKALMNPIAILGVALACSLPAIARMPAAHSESGFRPKVDARGFIDVWELRRAVARVEARQAGDDTDRCSREDDPDAWTPGARERARRRNAERACAARIHRAHAAYRQLSAAFNRAWLPPLLAAVRRGDPVAEVILRQCATTPVLDRRQIEATCDEDPQRQDTAARRLREIGFVPAMEHRGNPAMPARAASRSEAQQIVFDAYRQGLLGVRIMDASHGGNAPKDEAELEEIRRAAVIDAVLQEAPRAFTVSVRGIDYSSGWATDEFASLRLNRRPLTPGYLSWGRHLYHGGSNSPWTGAHYWRYGPMDAYVQNDRTQVQVSGDGDDKFLTQLREILATAERNIERYLREDPRWGVFLLRRVGHHEWVPMGTASVSGKLKRTWMGQWESREVFDEWNPVAGPVPRFVAAIFADGAGTGMTLRLPASPQAPHGDSMTCRLRYSGGLTYLPENGRHASSSTETALGYLPAISRRYPRDPGPQEVFAPLNPKKRYRQVLVQCPEGEWFDTNRVRFLLLAGDTLLEVSDESVRRAPVIVRHYHRSRAPAPATAGRVAPDPAPADVTANVDALAGRAVAARERLLTMDIRDLIDTLHRTRNESLYYNADRFPANLKEIIRRPGHVAELAAAYHADAKSMNDELFRFNIVMLLSYKLDYERMLAEGDKALAAGCLAAALQDASAWVRTESVWGLRFTGDTQYEAVARSLMSDSDSNVRKEARETAELLKRLADKQAQQSVAAD